mgnify:CR=1 FL=1
MYSEHDSSHRDQSSRIASTTGMYTSGATSSYLESILCTYMNELGLCFFSFSTPAHKNSCVSLRPPVHLVIENRAL